MCSKDVARANVQVWSARPSSGKKIETMIEEVSKLAKKLQDKHDGTDGAENDEAPGDSTADKKKGKEAHGKKLSLSNKAAAGDAEARKDGRDDEGERKPKGKKRKVTKKPAAEDDEAGQDGGDDELAAELLAALGVTV